ncbi:MAG: hypothetical protein Q8N26_24770 [Myxococcales bacterium]|nr:hypothetical protein [Myxococcales bacterium]
MNRPSNILHWRDVKNPDSEPYPGSDEPLGITARLSAEPGMFQRPLGRHDGKPDPKP